MKSKKIFTKITAFCLYISGIAALIGIVNKKFHRIPILMYHSITSDSARNYKSCFDLIGMSVSREIFEKQMAYIYRNYKVIGLDKFVKYLEGERDISPDSVVLTFDDGLKNNYDVALPILKKYGFTATFFLIGNSKDGLRGVWLHLLYEILDELSGKQVVLVSEGRTIFETECLDHKKKLLLAHKLKLHLSNLSIKKRDALLKGICDQNGINYSDIVKRQVFMSFDEIQSLVKSGNLIGAHTMSHDRLGNSLSTAKNYQEIFESMEAVKQFRATDFIPFSYPHGTKDSYNEGVKRLVKKSGMRCAVTTIEGLNNVNSDPYELKRIEIGNFGRVEFVVHLSGIVGDIKQALKKMLIRN